MTVATPTIPSIADILYAVAVAFEVQVQDALSVSKLQRPLHARYAATIILRETGRSNSAIGRAIRRDHSTIAQTRGSVAALLQNNAEFARKVEEARFLAVCPCRTREMAAMIKPMATIVAKKAKKPPVANVAAPEISSPFPPSPAVDEPIEVHRMRAEGERVLRRMRILLSEDQATQRDQP